MKFQHTISAQDINEFNKKVGVFLNTLKDSDYEIRYFTNIIPVQSEPVKIPGLTLPGGANNMQVNFLSFFFCFIIYEVEQPAQNLEHFKM